MKQSALVMALIASLSTQAFADVLSTTGGVDTPLNSQTPTNASNTSVVTKMAALAAQGEAVSVLSGGSSTQVFEAGKQAASEYLGIKFDTNREAAIAILMIK